MKEETNSSLSYITDNWNSSEAVIMYIKTNQTQPRTKIVKVIPALTALRHNVQYRIVSGNGESYFSMHKKKGVSSLHFKKHVDESKIFHLEIECKPFESTVQRGNETVHLEPYTIHLEIHVVNKV